MLVLIRAIHALTPGPTSATMIVLIVHRGLAVPVPVVAPHSHNRVVPSPPTLRAVLGLHYANGWAFFEKSVGFLTIKVGVSLCIIIRDGQFFAAHLRLPRTTAHKAPIPSCLLDWIVSNTRMGALVKLIWL